MHSKTCLIQIKTEFLILLSGLNTAGGQHYFSSRLRMAEATVIKLPLIKTEKRPMLALLPELLQNRQCLLQLLLRKTG
jgi:hypothetical protein